MPDRLPPLTALRAFEAASRLMSFQAAANELAVTPAALSYQIRQLEGETVQGVVTLEGETADAVLTEKIAQQGKHSLFIQGDRQRSLFLGLEPVTKISEQAGLSPGGDEQQA